MKYGNKRLMLSLILKQDTEVSAKKIISILVPSGKGERGLASKRSWVRIRNTEAIFHSPFIWIKACITKLLKAITWQC